MVAWLCNRIHRIYIYFAVGLLGTLHTMACIELRPDLWLHLIGAISIMTACIVRVAYEAGMETEHARAKRKAYEDAADFIDSLLPDGASPSMPALTGRGSHAQAPRVGLR